MVAYSISEDLPKEIPRALKNIGNTICRTPIILGLGEMEKVFENLSAMPPGRPDLGEINTIPMKYGLEFLH